MAPSSRAWASSNLANVVAGLEEFVSQQVRILTAALAHGLAEATPKDTTHAASNWPIETEQRSDPVGSKKAVSWGPFHSGIAMLAGWSITRGKLYISNMVKYIGDLDQGWSSQAPPGYVAMTIRNVIAAFNRS